MIDKTAQCKIRILATNLKFLLVFFHCVVDSVTEYVTQVREYHVIAIVPVQATCVM